MLHDYLKESPVIHPENILYSAYLSGRIAEMFVKTFAYQMQDFSVLAGNRGLCLHESTWSIKNSTNFLGSNFEDRTVKGEMMRDSLVPNNDVDIPRLPTSESPSKIIPKNIIACEWKEKLSQNWQAYRRL